MVFVMGGIGAGIGAALGWGVDAALDRSPFVFQSKAGTVAVAPWVGRRTAGAHATIRWR
jgi:hypothetical protein